MNKIIKTFATMMLLVATAMGASAQSGGTKTLTGTVLDENGGPMPGVTVYDTDKKDSGTMTNSKGQYNIIVGKDCKSLTFEMIGYKVLSYNLKDAALVYMELLPQAIEETVVTGIYKRKAESFTGAVQTVSGEKLKMVSSRNVLEALKNIDPSLLMVENLVDGSNPNTMAKFQLRGASSFTDGTMGLKSNFISDANMPLFILDGFETSLEKIQDMDMNRVQSITILKDASAKAIYGSKGGNGVIVIETKSLDSGRNSVSYTGQVAVELPDLTSYTLCNALQKLEVENRENYYTDNVSSTGGTEAAMIGKELYYERLRKAAEGKSTYWLSKPVRTGVTNKHSVSIELGQKELKSFTTFSYNNTQGAMKGSDRQVITGDMNLSYRHKIWTFRNIMSISSMKSNESPYGDFGTYAQLNPYTSPYDEEGNLVKTLEYGVPIGGYSITIGNPLYDASLGTKDSSDYLDFTDNLYVEVNPIRELRLVGRFGIETKRSGNEVFLPAEHSSFDKTANLEDELLNRGKYEKTDGRYLYYDADLQAQFNKKINEVHDLFATAQYSISETKFSEVTVSASGFPNSRMNDIIFARQYTKDTTPDGESGLNRNIGLLLTTGYMYDNRYGIDATVKGSASSVFGTNNKWGTFWSAGLAWNMHNEQWMKNAEWLQQLKLRASIGTSGNQNYATNNSLPVYKFSTNNFYNTFAGVSLANMENPMLGWEEKIDYNVGLDFRSKHFDATIDCYIADTRNLVFNRSLLPSTGFSTVSDNLGQVRNRGIEVSLTYKIFQKRGSFLSIFGRAALNENKITKISDVVRAYNEKMVQAAAESGSLTPVIQYYDGCPMNSIWVVPSLGVDPVSLNGSEVFLDKQGNMVKDWNAAYLTNMGSSDPLVNGNFGINGEFHGFGFNVIMGFRCGGYMYNSTLVKKIENADINLNVDSRIFEDRWYYRGQVTPFRNGYGMETKATSRFVQKEDVLTMSNATIYYEFPRKLIQPVLSRLRLSIVGNDLFTLSSIRIERGTSYPYARTVSFQVTATF